MSEILKEEEKETHIPTEWLNPNANEPFGWAPGTVRAIISIVVIISSVIFAGYEVWQTHSVPDWFIGELGVITAYYFGTRNAQNIMEVLKSKK
jgi:hypothetical protein